MKNKGVAFKILDENLYMTIATSDVQGNPWISNVYFAYDKDLNIYWYSPKRSNHSQYIRSNPNIAISIFNSTAVGNEVNAVYIKATAKELKNIQQIIRGLKVYGGKLLRTKFVKNRREMVEFISSGKDFMRISPLRMYMAKPTEIYTLAPSKMYKKHYVDSKIPVDINYGK